MSSTDISRCIIVNAGLVDSCLWHQRTPVLYRAVHAGMLVPVYAYCFRLFLMQGVQ